LTQKELSHRVKRIQLIFQWWDLVPKLKPAAHDACFPAGLLAFSKLLEILPSVWCNFSNLLKRKQSNRKTSIVCRWLKKKKTALEKKKKNVSELSSRDRIYSVVKNIEKRGL